MMTVSEGVRRWTVSRSWRHLQMSIVMVLLPTGVCVGCSQAPEPATAQPTVTVTVTGSTPSASARMLWSDSATEIHIGPPPGFPDALTGWRLGPTWTDQPRAFDEGWTSASGPEHSDFPATMNGCDLQRFLVRWRVIPDNTTVRVGLQHSTAPDEITGDVVHGQAGWMSLDGCQVPRFQLERSEHGSTLADVAVDVIELEPSP